VIFIPTTLVLKQGKYQALTGHLSSQFDISITLMVPIFTYLVCQTFQGSGLQSLISCGLLQGLYALQNLDKSKRDVVTSTIRYVAYLMRQIGGVLVGMLAPFFVKQSEISSATLVGFVLIVLIL
jgi:NhaP-type Na+/H+ or K+/H+ antiporter